MSWSFQEATAGLSPVLQMAVTDEMAKLSDPALGWVFDDFVAPDMINSGVTKGQIPWRDPEDNRAEQNTVHVVGKRAPRVDLSHPAYRDYTLQPHSLEFVQYDAEDRAIEQSGRSPGVELVKRTAAISKKLFLAKHTDLVTALTTTGNYPATCTGAVTAAWSSDSSTIVADSKAFRTAVRDIQGVVPNALLINDVAADHARHNAELIALISNNRTKVLTDEELMLLLDLDYLRITRAHYDTGRAGDAASASRILGAYAIYFYKPPTTNPRSLGEMEFMRTIRMSPPLIEHTIKSEPEKSPSKGSEGYYLNHIFKQGYWSHELITVDDVTTPATVGAYLATGLYS